VLRILVGWVLLVMLLSGVPLTTVAQHIVSGSAPNSQVFRISASHSLPLPAGTWRISWQSTYDFCSPGRQCGNDTSGNVYALENLDPTARVYAMLVRRNYSSVDRWPTPQCFNDYNEFRDFHGTTGSSLTSMCSRGWRGGVVQRSVDNHWYWQRVREGTRKLAENARISKLSEASFAGRQRTFEVVLSAPGKNRFDLNVFVDVSDGNGFMSTQSVMYWKDSFVRTAFDGLFSNKIPQNFELLSLKSANDESRLSDQAASASSTEIDPLAEWVVKDQQQIQAEAKEGQSQDQMQAALALLQEQEEQARRKAEGERLAREQQQRELALRNEQEEQARRKAEGERLAREQQQRELALRNEQEEQARRKAEGERLAREQQQRELALRKAQEEQARLKAELEQLALERQKRDLAQKEQARLALELQELRDQLKSVQKDVSSKPPAVVAASRRLALVIGNDAYANVPKLQNAKSDAKAMAQGLQTLGFKVTLQMDLSERGMKDALRIFRTDIQGGDEVVIFFAGHGVQLGAANYLLPTDIRGDSEEQVKDEAIPLQRILDDLSDRKARFSLAIIDACRDNPFRSTGRSIGGRGLAPASAASGQMVIFSAGSGQQALDSLGDADKDPNGLFTRVFLKEMKKPGQSIDRVIRTVRSEVVAMAKAVGHEQVPALYDQTLGDFFFVR